MFSKFLSPEAQTGSYSEYETEGEGGREEERERMNSLVLQAAGGKAAILKYNRIVCSSVAETVLLGSNLWGLYKSLLHLREVKHSIVATSVLLSHLRVGWQARI